MKHNEEIIELHDYENHTNSDDEQCRRELEEQAAEIVNRMEEHEALMGDNPVSKQLRRDALRDMPLSLTIKRLVKEKLSKTVNEKAKHRPLGFYKHWKYRISINCVKLYETLKSLVYGFELWYNSLKAVEGHFGSGVATHFKFLRWIFVMNLLICIPTVGFIIIPQLVYRFYEHLTDEASDMNNSNFIDIDNMTVRNSELKNIPFSNYMKPKDNPYMDNVEFSFVHLITGEGFLTNTTLYYGFYTNNTINLIGSSMYNMPYAYFLTMFFIYVTAFIVLSASMAQSYKRSFIETSGGLKNVFAHKIFCGWDYSIATKEGAKLKKAAIYNEIKELLSDSEHPPRRMSLVNRFWTRTIQIVCHLFVAIILAGVAFLIWQLLKRNHTRVNAFDTNMNLGSGSVVTSIVVTIIMTLGPFFFTWLIKFEDYKTPRNALYVSLFRTFQLKIVVVGVLVTFWLNHATKEQCWETSLGQEIYRLILIDFLFSVLFTSLVELLRYVFYKCFLEMRRPESNKARPEFDIARHTLQVIYNQTLFWMGLYFSPFLAVMVTIKLWFTWYIKSTSCLYFCRPASKSWRAAQTQTIFLVMTFLALFSIVFVFGYIMTQVHTSSSCGPFRNYKFMYEMVIKGLFQLQQGHGIFKLLVYLTKPGVITGVLIAISVLVYYLRAKSNAQIDMVDILREMLVIEAKDKEFLLKQISQFTEGEWLYNLKRAAGERNGVDGRVESVPNSRQAADFPGTSTQDIHFTEPPASECAAAGSGAPVEPAASVPGSHVHMQRHFRHTKHDYIYLTKRKDYK